MVRTKQTARGGSSQRPEGMTTAMFGGEGGPEEQFQDAPADDIPDEDLPKVLEDAEQPKAGKPSTSKSKGKTGEQATQATEGAQAPPEETPPDPTDPTPGTSKDPTPPAVAPTRDTTQVTTQTTGEEEIALTMLSSTGQQAKLG